MLTVTTPLDETDVYRFGHLVSQSLGLPLAKVPEWTQSVGWRNLRLIYADDVVVGGLAVLPMAQWFGGKAVRMAGIAGVAVAPEHRGSGVGSRLMRVVLNELRETGLPLATLYAATQPVYRRVGFEPAGQHTRYEMPLTAIDVHDTSLTMQPISLVDLDTVTALHETRAALTNGQVRRNEYLWERLFRQQPDSPHAYGYLVMHGDRPEGYILYTHKPGGRLLHDITVRDVVALTQAAGRRIWTFLADHRSRVDTVSWTGPPNDPLLYLLAERRTRVIEHLPWMLRLVDVPAAMAGRAFPPQLTMDCQIEVMDETLGWNHGRFQLAIADGKAGVSPGGAGTVRITVNALAALYSSHLSPWDLRQLGMIEGPDAALLDLAVAFAGPAPWMAEIF
ncbi:MAG: GNAT family N-acetyltransferase [Candidatus Sericytochromatia bacterium]|nr:GNAT family N-acetyltransferase [Candidatus Sericytochromatia bacterium]